MNYKELKICEICMQEKYKFKNGENCNHSLCNECYDKICQEYNNKCPICRKILSKENKTTQDKENNSIFCCNNCGDEIDESDYEYIVDRDDDIHICVYCYNDFMEFYCGNCNEKCNYNQLCIHGVSFNNGCCICEICKGEN